MQKKKTTDNDQLLLTVSNFKRGQLDACEILANHFFSLYERGQIFIKTNQVGDFIRSVKLNLEKTPEK